MVTHQGSSEHATANLTSSERTLSGAAAQFSCTSGQKTFLQHGRRIPDYACQLAHVHRVRLQGHIKHGYSPCRGPLDGSSMFLLSWHGCLRGKSCLSDQLMRPRPRLRPCAIPLLDSKALEATLCQLEKATTPQSFQRITAQRASHAEPFWRDLLPREFDDAQSKLPHRLKP